MIFSPTEKAKITVTKLKSPKKKSVNSKDAILITS